MQLIVPVNDLYRNDCRLVKTHSTSMTMGYVLKSTPVTTIAIKTRQYSMVSFVVRGYYSVLHSFGSDDNLVGCPIHDSGNRCSICLFRSRGSIISSSIGFPLSGYLDEITPLRSHV